MINNTVQEVEKATYIEISHRVGVRARVLAAVIRDSRDVDLILGTNALGAM